MVSRRAFLGLSATAAVTAPFLSPSLALGGVAGAQTAEEGGPPPEFSDQLAGGLATIVLGDSMAGHKTSDADEVTHLESWAPYVMAASMGRMYSLAEGGRNGQDTSQVLSRVGDVIAASPNLVLFQQPTNDAGQGFRLASGQVGPSESLANFAEIIRRLRVAGIKVIVVGCHPRLSAVDAVELWVRMGQQWCVAHGIPFIDPRPPTIDPTTGAMRSEFTKDGIHHSGLGAAVAGKFIWSRLETMIPDAPLLLPLRGNDPYNLLKNGLFLSDTNGDGVPDGWIRGGGAQEGITLGVVEQPWALGRVWEMTANNAPRQQNHRQVISQGFADGEQVMVMCKFGAESDGPPPSIQLKIHQKGGVGVRTEWMGSGHFEPGSVYARQTTVRPGTTTIMFQLIVEPGTWKTSLAQCGVYNLSRINAGTS